MDVVDRRIEGESDPFEDLDTASELQDLIRRAMPTEEQNVQQMNILAVTTPYLCVPNMMMIHGKTASLWE